jgi:hypothetical protein
VSITYLPNPPRPECLHHIRCLRAYWVGAGQDANELAVNAATHTGQTRLTITSTHAKAGTVQAVLLSLTRFLRSLRETADQLTDPQRLQAILARAFATFMRTTTAPPRLPPPPPQLREFDT